MSQPKSTIKKLKVEDLHLHEDIQRAEGMDTRRAQQMAERFNPAGVNLITLSERSNGDLFILDGRHRIAAARLAGYTGTVETKIWNGLTRAQEADLFRLLNNSKTASAISMFLAAVVVGEPGQVEISSIVERHGWKIGLNSDDGYIRAVQALERLYTGAAIGNKKAGPYPELADRTLATITEAWEWDRKSVDGPMLLGVGQLYARFGDIVDDVKLVAEMRDTRPGTVIGKGRALRDVQGGTLPSALAKVLVGLHNRKRRTNLLPEWVWTR